MTTPRQPRQRGSRQELVDKIAGQLARRRSTADVLFHQAVATHLGLAPADHKCLELLRDRGAMSGSELAAITGLTTGAITGSVARLEAAGYLRREPDSHDGRRQILYPVPERLREIHEAVFAPLRDDVAVVLEGFDAHQLAAIAEFLDRSTGVLYRHLAGLRGQTLGPISRPLSAPSHSSVPSRSSTTSRQRTGRRARI